MSQRDIDFLKDVNLWVHFDLCPVKRKRGPGWPDAGIVCAWDLTTVYVKNLFEFVKGPIEPQLVGCETHKYESVEALVADGWRVD